MNIARRIRLGVAALVCTSVGFEAPAGAVTLAGMTWVVPCNDHDGVTTAEAVPGAELAGGTYLVTTAGVCTIDVRSHFTSPTSTPCGTSTTGPIPCATSTVRNLPGAMCWESLLYATVELCEGPGGPTGTGAHLNTCASEFGVVINGGICLSLGGAGVVTQPSVGPMRAAFRDGTDPAAYDDNGGYFVVTAVLTPL